MFEFGLRSMSNIGKLYYIFQMINKKFENKYENILNFIVKIEYM